MKLSFKLFTRKIEVSVSRLDTPERVLYLANKLFDELQAAGCNLEGTEGLQKIEIENFNIPLNEDLFCVENIITKVKFTGKRDFKKGAK